MVVGHPSPRNSGASGLTRPVHNHIAGRLFAIISVISRSILFPLRNWHVEAVKCRRHQAIEAYKIDHLIRTVLTKGADRKTVKSLRQCSPANKLIGDIKGNTFILQQVVWL